MKSETRPAGTDLPEVVSTSFRLVFPHETVEHLHVILPPNHIPFRRVQHAAGGRYVRVQKRIRLFISRYFVTATVELGIRIGSLLGLGLRAGV